MGMLRVLLFALVFLPALAAQDYDLLVTNARIVDGAGNPWFRGSVAIDDGRIAAMGHLADATADRVIDAGDRVVAPGFIDIHSHGRRGIFRDPSAENLIRQGVTTIIEGNDGSSPVPLKPLLDKVRETGTAINFGAFLGQGSVRAEVMGRVDRPATADELTAMRQIVRRAMENGSLGLSTGLFYIPGNFTPTEEVIELAKVAAAYGGGHISHMRDEAALIVDSVNETIRIGEEGGLPTQVTHHKTIGKMNWGKSEETLALIDAARARGVDATIDQYPYTASSTSTRALFPQWSMDGGTPALNDRLQTPDVREEIKREIAERIEFDRGGGHPKNVQLAFCEWDESLDGKTLADVTADRGRKVTFLEAAETAIEIQLAGGCSAVYHAIGEQDVKRIMQHPAAMVATDGGVIIRGEGVPHPRNYGTFARVLGHYVRELGVIELEEAIRKMTSFPAQRTSQFDRGLLRPGMRADLVVFDPETVIDKAVFGDPHRYAEGIDYVVVNGEIVLDGGRMTEARPGMVLLGAGAR